MVGCSYVVWSCKSDIHASWMLAVLNLHLNGVLHVTFGDHEFEPNDDNMGAPGAGVRARALVVRRSPHILLQTAHRTSRLQGGTICNTSITKTKQHQAGKRCWKIKQF